MSTTQAETTEGDSSSSGDPAEDEFPQRLAILYFGHGAFKDMLVSGGPGGWSFGPVMDGLAPFADQAMFVSGVSVQYPQDPAVGDAHSGGIATLLTGTLAFNGEAMLDFFAPGTSVDGLVADQLDDTMFRTLNYIVAPAASHRVITWQDGSPVAARVEPDDAFDDVFAQIDFSATPQLQDAVDQLGADVDAFDAVDPSVRERERFRLHARAAVLGLRADLTRVVTLQLGTSFPSSAQWLGIDEFHQRVHQAITGDAAARDDVQAVHTAWMEEFATFISELDSVEEGTQSLLDHTVVVIVSEGGDLNVNAHQSIDLPVVIMGGEQTGLRLGEFVQLTDASQADLGLSVAQAVGVDLDDFGAPELDGQVIDELFVDP